MPAELPHHQRQQVIELHVRGQTRNGIARTLNISQGAVTRICEQAGLTFDRSQTRKATEARAADDRQQRGFLASETLFAATRVQAALLAKVNAGEGSVRDLAIAFGVLLDKHQQLVAQDSDQGVEEAKSMLGDLYESLCGAWRLMKDEESQEGS